MLTITLDKEDVEAKIIEGVVIQIASTLRQKIMKEAEQRLESMMQEALRDEVQKKAANLLEFALAKRLPKLNSYGEKVGDGVTVTERIVEMFSESLTRRVDDRGFPSTSGGARPFIEHTIHEIAIKPLYAQAKQEIDKIRKTAEVQVAAAVGRFIAENLVAPVAAAALPKN